MLGYWSQINNNKKVIGEMTIIIGCLMAYGNYVSNLK